MSKIYNKKVEYNDSVEYELLDDCVAVKIIVRNRPSLNNFFISRKEWDTGVKKYKGDLLKLALGIERKYYYMKPKWWAMFGQEGFYSEKPLEALFSYDSDSFEIINQDSFDSNKLVWFDNYRHLLYKLDSEFPLSIPYGFDYIDGMNNSNFNLDIAGEILKANPNVLNISTKSIIPYFNCSQGITHSIDFTVRLPQDQHDEICEFFKSIKIMGWENAPK